MTYFKDGWGGSHNFKFGGEMLLETGWYGYTQVVRRQHPRERSAATACRSSVFMARRRRLHVGSLGDGPNGNLLSVDKVNTIDFVLHRSVRRSAARR